MSSPIAIKRLTASDCTLFEAVFRRISAGNQKSINLNADVLTEQFYPNLAAVAAASNNEIALAISIFGPGGKGAHNLSRKIVKSLSSKNWRLNGEFISGPPGDTGRYDNIQPGDLAIMLFKGNLSPTGMDMILVSQGNPVDTALYSALISLFSNHSMIAVTPAQVAAAIGRTAGIPQTHPVHIAAADPEMDAALEDAAQGGFAGTGKLLSNKRGRKISASDFAKAKANAEQVGQSGEGLVNAYLDAKVSAREIAEFKWASAENAVEPYDFEIITLGGDRVHVDAKSTGGPFANVIHLSLAEVIEASGVVPYHIYRVFELNDDGGKLCISDDIRPLAQRLKTTHELHMFDGIRVDSFSVPTSALNWGPVEDVKRPDGA